MPRLLTFTYKHLSGPVELNRLLAPFSATHLVDCRFERGHKDSYWSEELVADTARRAGLSYYWEQGLGNPDYRIPGSRYPNSKPATRIADPGAPSRLVPLIQEGHVLALMCICEDAQRCHRRFILDYLLRHVPGLEILEL